MLNWYALASYLLMVSSIPILSPLSYIFQILPALGSVEICIIGTSQWADSITSKLYIRIKAGTIPAV
jgi:hypothetical protein